MKAKGFGVNNIIFLYQQKSSHDLIILLNHIQTELCPVHFTPQCRTNTTVQLWLQLSREAMRSRPA